MESKPLQWNPLCKEFAREMDPIWVRCLLCTVQRRWLLLAKSRGAKSDAVCSSWNISPTLVPTLFETSQLTVHTASQMNCLPVTVRIPDGLCRQCTFVRGIENQEQRDNFPAWKSAGIIFVRLWQAKFDVTWVGCLQCNSFKVDICCKRLSGRHKLVCTCKLNFSLPISWLPSK